MNFTEKKFLHSLSKEELITFLAEHGEPAFRAMQILDWLWHKGVQEFRSMMNIGIKLQTLLPEYFVETVLDLVEKKESQDGETTKYLWRLYDGAYVESVLIRSFDRNTVCVSCQVGCPIGCTFCASGKLGVVRNLFAAEIVAQVLQIQRGLSGKVTNIVYMGMGEPLRNYDEVVQSIYLLTNPELANFSQRRITLSTVGIVDNIRRLADLELGINLALSLHAPTQELRQKIIPYVRRYPLSEVLEAVDLYQKKTGRDITYEYILIHWVNDRVEDAEALLALLKGRKGSVNLIPVNPIAGSSYKRPPAEAVEAFREVLERGHIPTTCRYTKGTDIAAACGQLALPKNL